jgi:hypothetical protein
MASAALPFDRWFGTFRDGLPNGGGSGLPGAHRDSNRVPQPQEATNDHKTKAADCKT